MRLIRNVVESRLNLSPTKKESLNSLGKKNTVLAQILQGGVLIPV